MTKDTIWAFIWDAPPQAADIGDRMIPPAFGYFGELLGPLWDTLNIATLGTLIAIVIAVPVAFLAARNTTPSARVVRPLALLLIVASRSINSLIWGLLLVAIIGPGVLCRRHCHRPALASDSSPSCFMKRSKRSTRVRWRQ